MHLQSLDAKIGLDGLSEENKEALMAAFFSGDDSPLYDGTIPLLSELRKHNVPLGLIRSYLCTCFLFLFSYIHNRNSKTPAPAMRKRLAKYGIDQYFNVVVMAGDEGVQKPDPEVFMRAVAEAKIEEIHVCQRKRERRMASNNRS